MPVYEYRCPACDTAFELRRPMSESSAPATCPQGHPGARRLLSVVATVGSAAPARSGAGTPGARAAGPCGSACGCHTA